MCGCSGWPCAQRTNQRSVWSPCCLDTLACSIHALHRRPTQPAPAQWRGACGGFNLAGRTTGAVLGASCWIAGLAVLVEKRSRRMELALYLLARVGGRMHGCECTEVLGSVCCSVSPGEPPRQHQVRAARAWLKAGSQPATTATCPPTAPLSRRPSRLR